MAFKGESITIFDNGDYSLIVSLNKVHSPIGGQALTISSKWKQTRNPDEVQVKFMACLDREGLTKLSELIQKQLDKRPDLSTPKQVADRRAAVEEFDRQFKKVFESGADLSGFDTP